MQLSIHKRYLRTNTQNTIVVNSTPYESHIRRRYSNLEIYLLPLTDTVQLPVNGPSKSRYLARNVICTTVLSFNIQLYHCIPVFPRLYLYNTYLPNTDYTDYSDNRVVFIIWTDNVNAICATTISSNIQLWYCIAVFQRLYPLNSYLPNTDYTDNRVVVTKSFLTICTDNVNAICATTISSNIQLWYCIAVFPRLYPPTTYLPKLITLITLVTESFLTICTDNVNGPFVAPHVPLPLTDTVQLPVNGPCKSRYLAKNVCSTVLSLKIQLYYCIVVFSSLYPNTTYMPSTDYTDYPENRVVFYHLNR